MRANVVKWAVYLMCHRIGMKLRRVEQALLSSFLMLALSLSPEALALSNFDTYPQPATGDIAAGRALATTCTACHQADGNSDNPAWPKIAGLDPDYILKQLYAYQQGADGCRDNAVMKSIVGELTDEDMINLAAFFASQTMSPGEAMAEPLALGEQLYRGGDRQRGIPACMACHGPRGRGLASANTPHLSGQHANYIAQQLKAYRDQIRCTDANKMMRSMSEKLTDEDIAALANYVQGLY